MARLFDIMPHELRLAFQRSSDPKDQAILDCPEDSGVGHDAKGLILSAQAFVHHLEPMMITERDDVWNAVRHQLRVYMFS